MKFVIFLNLIMAVNIVRRDAKLDEASKVQDLAKEVATDHPVQGTNRSKHRTAHREPKACRAEQRGWTIGPEEPVTNGNILPRTYFAAHENILQGHRNMSRCTAMSR